MKTYVVWHFEPSPLRGDAAQVMRFTAEAFRRYWPDVEGQTYRAVAEVDATSLNEVYRLTNTIDGPWVENPGVRATVRPCRSTSVGDVIVDPCGVAHGVAPVGFVALSS